MMSWIMNSVVAQGASSLPLLIMIINAILHVIFASAVAKDSGQFMKLGQKTLLVSGITWAFATLMGGVYVAAIYWLLHHSTLTRSYRGDEK